MQKWVIPCNVKNFDIVEHFSALVFKTRNTAVTALKRWLRAEASLAFQRKLFKLCSARKIKPEHKTCSVHRLSCVQVKRLCDNTGRNNIFVIGCNQHSLGCAARYMKSDEVTA